ncbi:MAG: hypothetical protein HY958_11360 [Bacteroidia bacterium]|nr:hypothetical protein [Bacteroidia bacterium]
MKIKIGHQSSVTCGEHCRTINRKWLSLIPYFFLLSFSAAAQNELSKETPDNNNYSFAPNTNVQLIVPLHFKPYESINGFMHPGSSATLQVKEIDKSFKSVVKNISDETFTSQNCRLITKAEVKTANEKDAVIYIVSFTTGGIPYERMMLITGDDKKAVWINANYPEEIKILLVDVIRKSLLSVKY